MVYSNQNSYGKLFIDGIRTPFLDIGEIDDSPSDGGAICNVVIPGYLPTLKLTPKAAIYDYHGDLAAIGNVQIDSVKTGLRPKTSFSLISYSKHLQRKRIVGQFSNTLTQILIGLIAAGNASAFFSSIIFRTSPEIPSVIVSRYIDFKYLKDAISEVLASTGKVLTYKVPIDQSGIEIIEPGFAGLAPLPILKIDDFYINKKVGINNVSYTPIGVIASAVRFFGHNGRIYFKDYLGKAKNIPLDPLIMRAKDGVNNYPLPENADDIILIRITTVDAPTGACTAEIVITGENYTQNNDSGLYDFVLPNVSTDAVSLVHTANIWNVKESTSFSFYLDSVIDTTEGNITVTFEGTEIYNAALDAALSFHTTVIALSAYAGQSGELVATISLDAQPSTTTAYNIYMATDCCAIDTIAGTGTAGFNGDGGDRLATEINFPYEIKKDPTTGFIYFADNQNFLIRKIDSDGIITTVGGSGGNTTPPANGVAVDQDFGQTISLSIYNNCIYLNLFDWGQIGKIDLATGLYTVLYSDYNPGVVSLARLTVDNEGTIYFSDSLRHVIYKMVSETTTTVFAGTLDTSGFSGDTGPAASALLNNPLGLCCDSANNLYFADAQNNVIRKINKSDSKINTVIGGGGSSAFDIDALDFALNLPNMIEIDPNTGDFYFDFTGDIFRVDATTNKISRFAGISSSIGAGFEGDGGSPLTARFNFTSGIAVVSKTEFYISDYGNHRLRQGYCGDSPNP